MSIVPNPTILQSTRSVGRAEMDRLVGLCVARARDTSIEMPKRLGYASDALAYQMRIDAL